MARQESKQLPQPLFTLYNKSRKWKRTPLLDFISFQFSSIVFSNIHQQLIRNNPSHDSPSFQKADAEPARLKRAEPYSNSRRRKQDSPFHGYCRSTFLASDYLYQRKWLLYHPSSPISQPFFADPLLPFLNQSPTSPSPIHSPLVPTQLLTPLRASHLPLTSPINSFSFSSASSVLASSSPEYGFSFGPKMAGVISMKMIGMITRVLC